MRKTHTIVEKELNIPPDYQYKAINSKIYLQSNWHINKFYAISKYLSNLENKTVLDLGTGSGNFESFFAKKARRIVGVDYNDEALNFLRKRLKNEKIKNVKLLLHDIRELSSLRINYKVDIVVMIDVIEHIKMSQAKKLVQSLRNFIHKNTVVYVITPNYHSSWMIIEKILDKFTTVPKFAGEQHLAKYSKDSLAELFNSQGFSSKINSFNLFSYLVPIRELSKMLVELELKRSSSMGNLIIGEFKLK
jgi:2-polyprenyl-3-methyl-5-hydroxy-6-metoxy-1,4-benzoquinol methylase